jgi:hypothetical protein
MGPLPRYHADMPRPPARFVHVVFSLGAVLTGVGCQHVGSSTTDDGTPRACTEMGCSDSAMITAKLSPAGAPLGTHSFALEIDGKPQTCTVEFTREIETAHGQCPEGAFLLFGPAMQGTETSMDGVVGYTEEPIPGEFRWQLTIFGQPTKVHVVHTHDGKTILDQAASLTYTDFRPNGPECEPVCKSANVEWTGP